MKRKLAKTGFKSPYDSDYDDDEQYEVIQTILVQRKHYMNACWWAF